ncbi:MAG: AMP-binding protein [Streptosporangiales bacterium]|nr:AMP-binding protein [Streptosporangiales bacterium]
MTHLDLETLERAVRTYGEVPPGTVVGIDPTDATDTLTRLYAVRRSGGVPLVGAADGLTRPPPDAGFAVLTSGSTGRPRAVVRSWASWQCSFAPFSAVTGIGAGDVVAVPGPLSASLFLFAAVHALESGARAVLTSRWQPAAGIAAIADATAVHLTPTMLTTVLDRAPTALADTSVVCAGARLTEPLAERAAAAGARLTHYYGAAELSFVATGGHEHDLRPFPGVAVEVRAGEIWGRSDYLAAGYLGATGPLRTDADGWATVGDLGRRHPDGRLHVTGRGDQLVVSGGASVPVEDVETALQTVLPGREVVVLGLPHPQLGEVVTAVVVDDRELPARDELRRRLADLLEPAYRPRRWLAVAELPRTHAGKPARGRLRTDLATGDLVGRPLP